MEVNCSSFSKQVREIYLTRMNLLFRLKAARKQYDNANASNANASNTNASNANASNANASSVNASNANAKQC